MQPSTVRMLKTAPWLHAWRGGPSPHALCSIHPVPNKTLIITPYKLRFMYTAIVIGLIGLVVMKAPQKKLGSYRAMIYMNEASAHAYYCLHSCRTMQLLIMIMSCDLSKMFVVLCIELLCNTILYSMHNYTYTTLIPIKSKLLKYQQESRMITSK